MNQEKKTIDSKEKIIRYDRQNHMKSGHKQDEKKKNTQMNEMNERKKKRI